MKKNIVRIILGMLIIYMVVSLTQYRHEEGVAILGYHHILPKEDKNRYFKNNMWVDSCERFEQQMKWLKEEGYQSLTLDEFYKWHQKGERIPNKSVVLTFDDGFLSTNHYVAPILKKYGFVGSVFVIGTQIDDKHGPFNPAIRQHASLNDMKDQSVLQYYSHSYDLHHKKPTYKVNLLTEEQLHEDCKKQKQLVSCKYMAYPYGKYNDTIRRVLKEEGTWMAFSYHENRKASKIDDPYTIPRFSINAYTRFEVFQAMMNSR